MKPIDQLTDEEWAELVRRAIAMPDAPPHMVRRALGLWRQHQAVPAPDRPLLQRWMAAPSFDSWAAAPVVAGMRALPSEVRQLVFSSPDCDVDLRVAPMGAGSAGFALSGQLLGSSTEGCIEIAGLDGSPEQTVGRSAPVDALGEFRLDGLRQGAYRITVRLTDSEIELPALDVGPLRDTGM